MESMANMKMLSKNGLLYPMLIIAAISVIIFSALGVAMMTGLLPHAGSEASTYSPPTISRPATESGS